MLLRKWTCYLQTFQWRCRDIGLSRRLKCQWRQVEQLHVHIIPNSSGSQCYKIEECNFVIKETLKLTINITKIWNWNRSHKLKLIITWKETINSLSNDSVNMLDGSTVMINIFIKSNKILTFNVFLTFSKQWLEVSCLFLSPFLEQVWLWL